MAKRGQGEGTISKRADGTWWARITLGKDADGKQRRKAFYGKTRKEVQEKLTAALNDVNNNTYIEPSSMTVSQWVNIWLKEYKKHTLKPTSYLVYTNSLNWHVLPHIGDVKLKNLRADMIQTAINQSMKDGVTSDALNRAYRTFYGALEQAVKNDLIAKNLLNAITLPRLNRKPSKALTPDEQERFVALAKNQRNGDVFLLALATGMRIGEVLALTWDDVDIEKETININKSVSLVKDPDDPEGKWHNVIGTPKTKSSKRIIPMIQTAKDLLVKKKALHDAPELEVVSALRNIRVDKGLTQKDVADKIKIPLITYSGYEHFHASPDMATLLKITKALGCKLSDILVELPSKIGETFNYGDKIKCVLRQENNKTKDFSGATTVLKRKRNQKGYTKTEFANILGLSYGTYKSYEEGKNPPDLALVEIMARELNCDVAELLAPAPHNYEVHKYGGDYRYKLKTEPRNDHPDTNLVFFTDVGTPSPLKHLGKIFQKIAKEAEIEDVHIHSLRHTFATRGLEQGVPLKVMQEILGHSTLQMTADIYTHVLPETKHVEVLKMSTAIKF